MPVLLITYDLHDKDRRSEHDAAVLKYIRGLGGVQVTESSYAVETAAGPKEVFNEIKRLTDDRSTIFACAVSGDWCAESDGATAPWLKARLRSNF